MAPVSPIGAAGSRAPPSRAKAAKLGEQPTLAAHTCKHNPLSGSCGAGVSDPTGSDAMSNVLDYRRYRARVEFDAEDGLFFGRIAGIRDGVGFHADSVPALVEAFHQAVDDYIETCASLGKTPERPFSGKLMLRLDPVVHAKSVEAAELAGKSLNQWTEDVLRRATA